MEFLLISHKSLVYPGVSSGGQLHNSIKTREELPSSSSSFFFLFFFKKAYFILEGKKYEGIKWVSGWWVAMMKKMTTFLCFLLKFWEKEYQWDEKTSFPCLLLALLSCFKVLIVS